MMSIEVEPGAAKNIGQIFDSEYTRRLGHKLSAGYKNLVRHNLKEEGRFRYIVFSSFIALPVDEHAELYGRYQEVVSSISFDAANVDLEPAPYVAFLRHDPMCTHLGWHIDLHRDIRIITNVGEVPTSVHVSTMADLPEVTSRPTDICRPIRSSVLEVGVGESYIINGVADLCSLTPHATPPEPDRMMLAMDIGTRLAMSGEIAERYRENGGLTLRLAVPDIGYIGGAHVPRRSFARLRSVA